MTQRCESADAVALWTIHAVMVPNARAEGANSRELLGAVSVAKVRGGTHGAAHRRGWPLPSLSLRLTTPRPNGMLYVFGSSLLFVTIEV